MKQKKNATTITFKREERMLLKHTARRLGYHTISEYIIALHNLRLKMAWSKDDIYALATWGKIPVVVTGKSPQECLDKLGVEKGKPFSETMTIEIPVVAKKKSKKEKKKQEEPKKEMPTSEQFFSNKTEK